MNFKDQHSAATTVLAGVAIAGRNGSFDVTLADGQVQDIAPSQHPQTRVLTPLLADAHVHLDKTHTFARAGTSAQSLFEAIARMEADKPNWSAEDLYERASIALLEAWQSGVAAMRTHVDWMGQDTPLAWSVLKELRASWKGRIDLQLAALTPLDSLSDIAAHIAPIIKEDDGIMGAFVYRNDQIGRKLTDIFALSRHHDIGLDFHVDEGLETYAHGFDDIVRLTNASRNGPPVLCGHACSLSVRPSNEVAPILDLAAEAGVGLIALPTTNGYLQDNRPGRTPRHRGIAPIVEAKTAGMDVLLASDNVRDVFFPFGSYDLWDLYRTGVQMAHLDTDQWLGSVSTQAAAWCGSSACHDVEIGATANFIEFASSDLTEAISSPRVARNVWRNGTVIDPNEVPR